MELLTSVKPVAFDKNEEVRDPFVVDSWQMLDFVKTQPPLCPLQLSTMIR